MSSVDRLKSLHSFLYQEAIPMSPSDATSLLMGNLHALYFKKGGRKPTIEEWNQVDVQTQASYNLLNPTQRRKFLVSRVSGALTRLPIYLLFAAVISIIIPVFALNLAWLTTLYLVFYLVWTGSLGSLGALSSIGMNALSIQDDITFDITNAGLRSLRVIIGALFAVVLDAPFGYHAFFNFCNNLAFPVFGNSQPVDPSEWTIGKIILLLAPFIFGYSTSTVILILNQLIDAVQSLFGKLSKEGTNLGNHSSKRPL